MNKKKILSLIFVSAVAIAIVLSLQAVGLTKGDPKANLKLSLKKPNIVDGKFIAFNNWRYIMHNDGHFMYDHDDIDANQNNAGGEFPRNSGTTVVFAAGPMIGALKGANPVVSETNFHTEFQPGRILNGNVPFPNLIADTTDGPETRLYVIEQGDTTSDDYLQWPSYAPRNSKGDPASLNISAGQTYAVFNDIDLSLVYEHPLVSPDPGLGLEIMLESFNPTTGPSNDVVILKYRITNKTNVTYHGSYFCLWMDADVDQLHASNDAIGCDSSRGLGFTYNSTTINGEKNMCVGMDYFQGPVVSASDVHPYLAYRDAAHKTILKYDALSDKYAPRSLSGDSIWLGATTLNTFPGAGDPVKNVERYNLMKGLTTYGGIDAAMRNGWIYPGDPVTTNTNVQTGAGSDRRNFLAVGPFTMPAGGTQEIWAGVIGGLGSNRLNCITDMRASDDAAQASIDAGFVVPSAPVVPDLTIVPGNKAVSLSWGDRSETTPDRAGELLKIDTAHGYTSDYVKYDFEGYRVWRSYTGLPGSYRMLAQYDKIDGIREVSDVILDPSTGKLSATLQTIGTESGIKHLYVDSTVTNYQKYYYSVTAYDAQPYLGLKGVPYIDPATNGVFSKPTGYPVTLESKQTANLTSVVPGAISAQIMSGGVDSLHHTAGASDGVIEYRVVNPGLVQSGSYSIQFMTLHSQNGRTPVGLDTTKPAYYVKRGSTTVNFDNKTDDPRTFYDGNGNKVLDIDSLGNITAASNDAILDDRSFSQVIATKDTNLSDENFGMVDGILFKVYAIPTYFKSITYTPEHAGATPWWTGVSLAGRGSNYGVSNPNRTLSGVISGGGPMRNANGTNTADGAISGANKDFEIRFSRDSTEWGYSYATAGSTGPLVNYMRIPFKVFEIDPTDGNSAPRQLNTFVRNRSYAAYYGYSSSFWACWAPVAGYGLYGNGDDGFGPELRGVMGFDTSNYDLGTKTDYWGTTAATDKLGTNNVTGMYDPGTACYAGFFPTYRDQDGDGVGMDFVPYGHLINSITGTYDGLAYRDSTRKIMDYDYINDDYPISGGTVATVKQQVDIYKAMPDAGRLTVRINHQYSEADVYTLYTTANQPVSAKTVKKTMDRINVVPNPYYARASMYQTSASDKKVKFTHLPDNCTITIFNVAGDLVRTIKHNSTSSNDRTNTAPLEPGQSPDASFTSEENWDLRTQHDRYVASGMYIALVDAKGIGKKLVKFAIIQEKR